MVDAVPSLLQPFPSKLGVTRGAALLLENVQSLSYCRFTLRKRAAGLKQHILCTNGGDLWVRMVKVGHIKWMLKPDFLSG